MVNFKVNDKAMLTRTVSGWPKGTIVVVTQLHREEQIRLLNEELEILVKYPDEEAYLAAQIDAVMKKKGNVAAIAEILRKHKATDFL